MHHIFFAHSSDNGYLGELYVLVTVNGAAVNMVQPSLLDTDFISVSCIPAVGLLYRLGVHLECNNVFHNNCTTTVILKINIFPQGRHLHYH